MNFVPLIKHLIFIYIFDDFNDDCVAWNQMKWNESNIKDSSCLFVSVCMVNFWFITAFLMCALNRVGNFSTTVWMPEISKWFYYIWSTF